MKSSNNKYLIELNGDNLDIENLAAKLKTNEWRIIQEAKIYFLTSDVINKLSETSDIMSKTEEFLKILNGSAKIFDNSHKKITTGSLTRIDENGNKSVTNFLAIPTGIRVRELPPKVSIGNENNAKVEPSIIENWIEKALIHSNVREVLYLFNELSWLNLYKIDEIIYADVGRKNIHKFISNKNRNNFKQTANSHEAIGDLARHANKYKSPEHPMSLVEAIDLVKKMFKTWVKTKS